MKMSFNEYITEYLDTHMITEEVVNRYKLDITNERIGIPVYNIEGNILFYKYRNFNSNFGKYSYQKGSTMALFNINNAVESKSKRLCIVEGEFDAMALENYLGNKVPVVSSTGGAGSWNTDWNDGFIEKFENIHILLDNDKAGIDGTFRVLDKIINSVCDVCNIHVMYIKNTLNTDICDVLFKKKVDSFYRETDIKDYIGTVITLNKYDFKSKSSLIRKIIDINEKYSFFNDSSIERTYLDELKTFISKKIQLLSFKKQKQKQKSIVDRVGSVSKIKEIPITNFINFSGNKAICIFHNERNPSMIYNGFNSKHPNTVHCYSCGKHADVISVYMTINNLSFKEACEELRNKYVY